MNTNIPTENTTKEAIDTSLTQVIAQQKKLHATYKRLAKDFEHQWRALSIISAELRRITNQLEAIERKTNNHG